MNFIENESAEKLRGGYYTDPLIARYLAGWALAAGASSVLEPSCGDGAFIAAVSDLRPRGLKKLTACEILAEEAAKARVRSRQLPRATSIDVICDDFLSWALDGLERGARFDAVIGNPPFIRYQYLPEPAQRRAEALFAHLDLPFTRHTNAWVPFVLASISLLRPGGRLAMVVPAELLHVLHAQAVRTHLLRSCARVLVIDPEDIWFQGTLQGVVLLLAERGDGKSQGSVGVVPVRGALADLPDANAVFAATAFVPGPMLERKWTIALLHQRERSLLNDLAQRPGFARFGEKAGAAVGIVTGANQFFLVPDAVVEAYGLQPFAHAMFGRSDHVQGVIYDDAQHERNRRSGLPTNFLWFTETDAKKALPAGARRYVERGEAERLQDRFKCRIRSPWYAVPSVFTSPVGMLKRSHDFPRLVLNEVGAFTTDTAYRVTPREGVRADALVHSFVNSLTALSAELEGRHYGGGVLELVPSEIARLQLPPLVGGRRELRELDRDVAGRSFSADELLARADDRVLSKSLTQAERETLAGASRRLRHRRQRISSDEGSDNLDGEVGRSGVRKRIQPQLLLRDVDLAAEQPGE